MARFTSISQSVADLYAGYVSKGCWQGSVISYWERNAQEIPDKEALVDSRLRLTWRHAQEASDRLALGLRALGLERDDTIAVELPWSVEFALVRLAHEKAGLVCAELAHTNRHQEVSFFVSHANVRAIVIPWVFRDFDYYQMVQEIRADLPQLEHIIVAGPQVPQGAISLDEMLADPIEGRYPSDYLAQQRHSPFEMSTLWHTTGTTGLPKLVESAPAAAEWAGRKHVIETGEKLSAADTTGIICPAITGPNMMLFYGASMVGARIVFMEHFRPADALALIARERVTVTAVVPAQMAMMLDCPEFGQRDLSSLRYIVCAGASLNFEMARRAEELIGCPIVQHYGSQEDGVVTLVQHCAEPRSQRLLTVGKPSVDCDVRMVDENGHPVASGEVGAIEGRGPCMQAGYHKDVEATRATWTADGYCKMGDLGRFDESGNIILIGRSKDMIIRGGQNIYPIEVENLLMDHPNIALVAIVGVPDPVMGERACAFVVPKANEGLGFQEMVEFLKSRRIAPYKIPERLELREKFPLVGDQKVDKKALLREIMGESAG